MPKASRKQSEEAEQVPESDSDMIKVVRIMRQGQNNYD